jgi:FtsH-binding integral membrane protein
MSALKTTADQPALQGLPIAHDQARALLGQVMGLVALTVAFTALGAYLGRDLSGATGLLLFIAAFACIIGLNVAAAKGREQLGLGIFGAFTIFDLNRLRRSTPDAAVPIAAAIFLDIFNIFLLALSLFGGGRRD